MTTRFEPTKTTAQVRTSIRAISVRVRKNVEHEVALECMRHAYKHGDVTLFLSLCFALLGPSGRRQGGLAMIKWGREWFPVSIQRDDAENLTCSLKKGRSEGDWNFPDAVAHPFDEASEEEANAVIFDTEALLKIITGFSNRKSVTDHARTLAKTLITEVEQDMGRTPEATLAVA